MQPSTLKFRMASLLLLLAVLSSTQINAQNEREIEEIVVTGSTSLRVLRREMVTATVDVFEIFNALNSDDEYDMVCKEEKIIGSLIKKTICITNYTRKLLKESAQDNFLGIPGSLQTSAVISKNTIQREMMLELVNSNPALNEAVLRLNELKQDYEAAMEE